MTSTTIYGESGHPVDVTTITGDEAGNGDGTLTRLASVTPIPSRVPPPGDASVEMARRHYEVTAEDEGRWTLTTEERVAVAHLRGWAHFGPLCPICFPGRTA
jgi:hypothetical protein